MTPNEKLADFFRREYPTLGFGDQYEGHFPFDEGELYELAKRVIEELEDDRGGCQTCGRGMGL